MAKKRIKRIELERFRGATTTTCIEFDTKKPLVLIFGENGSGKSTIGNAVDFVCNRSKGSLEYLSSTGNSSIVSIGSDPSELRVRLHVGETVWEGRQDGRKILVDPANDIPKVATLRRSKLLRLVEATPSDRFDTIRSFIDFDKIEKSEQKLRDAARKSGNDLERKAELHTQANTSLDSLWVANGRIGSSVRAWAEEKLSQDLSVSRSSLLTHDLAIAAVEAFYRLRDSVTKLRAEVTVAESALTEVQNRIATNEVDGAESGVKLVELLTQVKSFIGQPYDSNECPACESTYDLGELRQNVDRRLSALNSSRELASELLLKRDDLAGKNAVLERALAALASTTKNLKDPLNASLALSSDLDSLRNRFAELDLDSTRLTAADLLRLSTLLNEVLSAVKVKKEDLSTDITLYEAIKAAVDLVETTEIEVQTEDAIYKALKAALQIVHGTRITHTKQILDSVFDDFLAYWEAIHPGEPLKPTKLALSEVTKGSLEQYGSFGEHDDISPQAYFSESHLDTLGFCYWLAIAKYATKGNGILILDDVFTSVDNAHSSRIVELLIKATETFDQVILTTHIRKWYDAFRYGSMSQGKTCVMELGNWSLNTGINTYPTRMEVEKLADLLAVAPLDRQSVCAKAGVLLEQMFDELTKQYKCSMPRGPRNEYTLDAYAGATKKLFGKLKIRRPAGIGVVGETPEAEIEETTGEFGDPELSTPAPTANVQDKSDRDDTGPMDGPAVSCSTTDKDEEIFLARFHEQLYPFVSVRNQVGAHFNLTAEEFVDSEILRFGNLTVELISTLLCRCCRGLANRLDKDTGAWQCECKQTSMLPNSL